MLDLMRAPRLGLWMVLLAAIVLALPGRGLAMPMPGDGPPKAMEVSENTGDATMRIPIPVPPGTGGFAPELALTYSSSGGDGPFGVGWSLEFGEIRRSIRFGIPTFDDNVDRFELNGQLLVLNPAESSGNQARYHTSTETFVRILHIKATFVDKWELTRPDGVKFRFGLSESALVRKDDSNTSSPIFRWMLEEMEDPFGNVIKFLHVKQEGEAYPQGVYYSYRNGVPVGALRKVDFDYVPRPDPSLTFMGGVRRNLIFRLNKIEVRTGETLFRKIQMTYAGQPGAGKVYRTGRSRLVSAQVFGVGGTEALPAQRFEYSDASDTGSSPAWTTTTPTLPPGVVARQVRFGEINGDGRIDMVRAHEAADGSIQQQVFLNTGSGWALNGAWSEALQLDPGYLSTAGRRVQAAYDFNLVSAATFPAPNPVLFTSDRDLSGCDSTYQNCQARLRPSWRLDDINGDGRIDLIYAVDIARPEALFAPENAQYTQVPYAVREVWLNNGATGWVRNANVAATLPAFEIFPIGGTITLLLEPIPPEDEPVLGVYPREPHLVQLDGDGLPDVVVRAFTGEFGQSPAVVAYMQGPSGFVQSGNIPPLDEKITFTYNSSVVGSRLYGDLNNDGLTDIVERFQAQDPPPYQGYPPRSFSRVYLNTGVGWCGDTDPGPCGAAATGLRLPTPAAYDPGIHDARLELVDLNGDGWLDLLRTDGSVSQAEGLRAWIHNPSAPGGSVWVEDSQFKPLIAAPPAAPDSIQLLDFNADGAIDQLRLEPGQQSYAGRVAFSDLLSRVENGRGGTIDYTYTSAAKQQDVLFNIYVVNQTADAEGVVKWTTGPVVTSRSMSGLDVDPVTENVLYGQPRFHMGERMSLGFGGIRRTVGLNGGERIFEQRQGVAGLVRAASVSQLCTAQSRTTNTYHTLAGNDPAVGLGSTSAARVGRLIGSTAAKLYGNACSGAETTGSAVVKSFEYGPMNGDPYRGFNFVTRTTTSRRTGTVVETRRLRAPDTTRWIAGLPERVLVTNSAGSELAKMEMVYGNEGRPTQMTAYDGPRGDLATAIARTTTMSYDGFGNVRSMTDAAGRTTGMCYDGDALFLSGSNCNSPTTEATHSVAVAVRDPLEGVTAFTPDPVTGLTTLQHRLYSGDQERSEFDAFGRLKRRLVQPAGEGEVVLSEADYFDLNEESGVAQEHVITRARLQSSSTESVRTASYLDGFGGEVRRVEDGPRQSGQSRYFGVSARRNMATMEVTTALPASCGADPHCLGLTSGTQPRRVVSADALGRPVVVSTPTGVSKFDYRSVTRSHPDTGNQQLDAVLEMDPRGYLTQRIFDGNQLIWVEECANAAMSNPSNANLSGVTCQSPATTFYRYEATGELQEAYDALATSITDPSKATLRFVRDSLGRVIQTYDINKTAPTLTGYNAAGKMAQQTNARGQLVSLQYDALNRLKTTSYPMGAGVTQEYSIDYDSRTRLQSQVRLRSISSGGTSTVFTQNTDYDALGRAIRNRLEYGVSSTLVTETDFDLGGRATRLRYPDVNTEVAYEYEGGYLRRVCELAGAASCNSGGAVPYLSNIDYDGIGREVGVTGFTPPDNGYAPAVMSFTYNPATYNLDRLRVSNAFEGIGAETLDLSYGRDPAGNVTSITDNSAVFDGGNDISLGAAYTYDARNRLASWTRAGQAQYFTYNAVGNLTGKQVGTSGATNQTYDAVRRHRVTQAGGMAFLYDADGNVTQRGAQELIYDPLDRLTSAGSASIPFTYGVDGLRVAGPGASGPRIFVGDLFEWEPATGKAQARIFALGRQVAAKTIGTATLRTGLGIHGIPLERIIPFVMGAVCWVVGAVILLILLVHGGLASGLQLRPAYGTVALCLIALVALPPQAWAGFASPPGQGTYRRWIWQDPLGTSVYITDEGGLAIHARAFDPFGGVAVERTTEPTERTFAGHPFESGSGLYYMKARWYDPITGRFQSVDPVVRDMSVPQSMNGYSYVENNPVNMIDPTGMEGTNDLKGLTGGGPDKFGETSTCFATCSVVFSLNTGRAPSPNAGGADPNVLFGKIMILSKPLGETGAGPRVAQPVQERSYVLITDTVTLRPGEAAVLQPRPTGEKAILRVDGIDDRIFTGLLVDKFGEQPLYLSLQPRFEFAFEGRAVLDLDYENPLFITDGLGTVGSEIPAPNFANFIFEPGVPGAEFKFQYILINKGNASLRFTTTIISTNVY